MTNIASQKKGEKIIKNVVATMSFEGYDLDESDIEAMKRVASGITTSKQEIENIKSAFRS